MERTFEGFGHHEKDPESEEEEKEEQHKAKQVLLAVDRDLDGKINLAE